MIRVVFLIISVISGLLSYFMLLKNLPSSGFIGQFLWFPYKYMNIIFPEYLYLPIISVIISIITYIFAEILLFVSKDKNYSGRGSAHWATKKDVKEFFTDKGVPVGKFKIGIFKKIIMRLTTHLLTIAPTRSGKGIGGIVPASIEYKQSLICLDIKGENYAVTNRARRDFSSVYVINPFKLMGIKTNSYNWLDSIDINNDDCQDKSENIASMIVGRDSTDSIENHFKEMAIRLIQGVILLCCADEDYNKRNIVEVAKIIHTTPLEKLCAFMWSKKNVAFGSISKIGAQFAHIKNEREQGSILSTAQKSLNFLDNIKIANTLIKSDFNINNIQNEIMTIYIIIPQDKVKSYKAYIKVFFDLVLSAIISNTSRKYNVLFLLDEIAQLGYMDNIVNAVPFIRGLGGQFWFFFQSYPQMESVYGKESKNIMANCSQIFYGCNDYDTAKLISNTLGKRTIKEYNNNAKLSQYIGKELLFSNEIRELSPENPIIFVQNKPPIKVKRLCYYKDKEYRGLFDKNPYI